MSGTLQAILIGGLAGSIPTLSMMGTALFAKEMELSTSFQASAQNLCAGLILGAVAKELFPALHSPDQKDNLVGVTVGFFVGLFFVNFLDYAVEWIEGIFSGPSTSGGPGDEGQPFAGDKSPYQSLDENDLHNLIETAPDTDARPIIELASQAVASPMHRDKIRTKMAELLDSIAIIQEKSTFLIAHKSAFDPLCRKPSWNLMNSEEEMVADQIDEQIHRLQYNLDHCRRLVQGCESNIVSLVPRLWITEVGKGNLVDGLEKLREGASALVCFIKDDNPTTQSLIEIHKTMSDMDNYIHKLHDTVEEYSFKWGRRGHRGAIGQIPDTGSTIPMGLIIPVTVDCIVDGFLVGTTCAINTRAGFILALANFIEMGFLGLAVSLRIKRCTASSALARYSCLILPPLVMLAASMFGAFVGAKAREYPMLYIGFISFGVVALLYLVVNELLVEARESLTGNEQSWSGMIIFLGVYFVLLLDLFMA